MNPEQLRQYLAFYRDIGVKEIRRAESPVSAVVPAASQPVAAGDGPKAKPVELPVVLPGLAPENDSFEKIQADIGDCRRSLAPPTVPFVAAALGKTDWDDATTRGEFKLRILNQSNC